MKYSNNNTSSSGIGILGVLQIVFIVLKCLKLITWPWKTVLIPTWISLGLFVLAVILIVAYEVYYARK